MSAGRRIEIDHAEGRSRPIGTPGAHPEREAQPRGAKLVRGVVDHREASERFLAAPDHLAFHDRRLWDLREKRDREAKGIAEWEALREQASLIKSHALSRLAELLEEFEARATANGVTVHWARDGAEHNRIVEGILHRHGADRLVKSKSMLTEECGFRDHMRGAGIAVVETDLGERIQQLDGEDPSHVV
ncbi:MAG: lactate utilization protein, partial [Gluconacetobacter diazotrophicus]|nr:lactate utilization protein [Gluconacetobacter diazotrophicus]